MRMYEYLVQNGVESAHVCGVKERIEEQKKGFNAVASSLRDTFLGDVMYFEKYVRYEKAKPKEETTFIVYSRGMCQCHFLSHLLRSIAFPCEITHHTFKSSCLLQVFYSFQGSISWLIFRFNLGNKNVENDEKN